MDPCPYVRVLVGNLALKVPVSAPPAGSGVHPSTSPCFAEIRLKGHRRTAHTAAVCLLPPESCASDAAPTIPAAASGGASSVAAAFHLSKDELDRIVGRSASLFARAGDGRAKLKISVYSGRRGTTCGVKAGRLLGKVRLMLDLRAAAEGGGRAVVFHSGWVEVGKGRKSAKASASNATAGAQLYVTVKAEPDPRFVFEFDGEPECSPQVFQVQGNKRQPVFTCNFSCRTTASGDRHLRSRSVQSDPGSSRSWLSSFGSDRERLGKERKGWSVTVHDLSGSPVALASMVTPFVASPGTDRVSRSNPGAWLILRPGDGTWKPWGRLEAWRERGGSGEGLGYRFELLQDTTAVGSGINLAESTISSSKGGEFSIDLTGVATSPLGRTASPGCSPRGSGDFGYGLWPFCHYRGFVMSSTVSREGRGGRPMVEVGVQHVGCTEDAAAFVALAAAVDLSVDACRLFSQKLRKELSSSNLLY